MTITDLSLLMAIADATDGKRVLFLTNDDSEANFGAKRSVEMTIENFRKYGNASLEEARSIIVPSGNQWHVRFRSNGWILFCPLPLLNPNDDLNNPAYVYMQRGSAEHERMTYASWRTVQRASVEASSVQDEDMSVWDRLMSGD